MRTVPFLLVVDDDEVHRAVSAYALESAGFRVRVAASGAEALREASDDTPDLILLDLQMPELSGWETLRRLRESGQTEVPVLALTGTRIDDAAPLRHAGFCGYASKTISHEGLAGLVQQCLGTSPPTPGYAAMTN